MIGRAQYRDADMGEPDHFKETEKISHIEGNEFLNTLLVSLSATGMAFHSCRFSSIFSSSSAALKSEGMGAVALIAFLLTGCLKATL